MEAAPQLAPATPAAPGARFPQIAYIVVLSTALAAGVVLARRNLRAGRVDRVGAARAALCVFVCDALAGVLSGHHPPSLEAEATFLTTVAGAAALVGAEVWLAYAALEPYVRRRWPQALVSWTRLLRRRAGDPLVSRDLLVGAAAGIASRLLDLPRGTQAYVDAMAATREAFGAVAHSVARSIFYALFALFLLVLLRMALRLPAVAALVWLIATTASYSRWDQPRLDVALVAAQMLIILLVLQRLGLLAAAATIFAHLVTLLVPLTMLPQAAVAVGVLAVMIVAGLRNKSPRFLH